MTRRLIALVVLGAAFGSTSLRGQGILLLEQRFSGDSAAQAVVTLKRKVVYRAELSGPGTPAFQPLAANGREAFIVPVDTLEPTVHRFQIFALQDGPHTVTVGEIPAGTSSVLRLYQDSSETRRISAKRERTLSIGVLIAGGVHSGYRLDSTGGPNPRRGRNIEGCILLETGPRFGTCVGGGGERLPDVGYSVTWLFIEEQLRFLTARILGARRTDFGGLLRLGQAFDAGPRGLDPDLFGFGLYLTQSFDAAGGRHGLRLLLAWHHNRLGNVAPASSRHFDRFSGGLVWVP